MEILVNQKRNYNGDYRNYSIFITRLAREGAMVATDSFLWGLGLGFSV